MLAKKRSLVKNFLPAPQLPTPTAMSDITYSRAYLRSIPEELRLHEKKQVIKDMYRHVLTQVVAAASSGKSSQLIGEKTFRHKLTVPLTDDDIITALSEKFPDCVISFQEAWADTSLGQRAQQKCILIDWS